MLVANGAETAWSPDGQSRDDDLEYDEARQHRGRVSAGVSPSFMTTHRIRTRLLRGTPSPAPLSTETTTVGSVLEDAAHYPGGHAAGLVIPRSEADVADWLARGVPVLAVGAQSSLTGGATPFGEVVLSTARLNAIVDIGQDTVRVQAGVPLSSLQEALAPRGLWFPPAPTYLGACVGGVIATNAAGAATFKYGSTRSWVRAVTVGLAGGDVLEVERGQVRAQAGGFFEIERANGRTVRVPAPTYRLPDVPKCSAGYFAAPELDLVDLFIGSEGTLGVVIEATLDVRRRPASTCLALVPVHDEGRGIELVARLRSAAQASWATGGRRGVDISAIEHIDRRSLDLLSADGALDKHDVTLPDETALVLLVLIELPDATSRDDAWAQLSSALTPDAPDTPLGRFCRILHEFGAFEDTEVALPGDTRRERQLLDVREAVPEGVNRRVAFAKREADPRISKTAGDVVVPFHRFADMMGACRQIFAERRLDYAVWGHISDGNIHPNVLPTRYDDVIRGREALLALGREVIGMGGSPLAEHGVGRNPIKQILLRELLGDEGLAQMRAIKHALDPNGVMAPGVLLPAE